jgi:acetyl-CoA carboxylase carboxyltransferase component
MTWQPELDDVRRRRDLAERMGGPDKVRRQHEAGRLTVRERLAALLDDGSFDEIGTLAGTADYDSGGELADFTPANFVTGTGRIDGRKVVVGGDDFTIRGGVRAISAVYQSTVPGAEIIDPRETRPLLCDWIRDAYAALPPSPGKPSFGTRP